MLVALAEFAATLTSPLAAGLVLVLAFALQRPALVRSAGVVVGAGLAIPGLLAGTEPLLGAVTLLAAAAAGLVQAEICLHFVLPAWRLACALAAWLLVVGRVLLARLALLDEGGDRYP